MLTFFLFLVIAMDNGSHRSARPRADPPMEMTGVLNPFLTASEPSQPVFCAPATDADRKRLVDPSAPVGCAWTCKLFCSAPGRERAGLLVEGPNGRLVLYVDLNRDDRFTRRERHHLPRGRDLLVQLPPEGTAQVQYPVRIRMAPADWELEMPPGGRALAQSYLPIYKGQVRIGGRRLAVEYPADWSTLAPVFQGSWIGIDGNGDGQIDRDLLSPERAFAMEQVTVVRAGDRYVSTTDIDPITRVVKLREHPRADYRRIELEPGATLPDFTFTDLSGAPRRLSDMRGRLALLVVWTPWCPPAVRELRHIEHAYRALCAEGLDVVGLAESGELDQIRSVASAHGLSWPTSTPDSVRELLKDRLHIFSNPSYIVVDADRRIVMVSRTRESDLQLRGTKLAETLQRLLRQPR